MLRNTAAGVEESYHPLAEYVQEAKGYGEELGEYEYPNPQNYVEPQEYETWEEPPEAE